MKSLIVLENKFSRLIRVGLIRTYGGRVFHVLIHLSSYCRYMDLKKALLLKKIRNYSQPLKLQQNIKICHKLT